MARLPRKVALDAMKAAGAAGDTKAWTRLYVENRISLAAARDAWRVGERFGRFIRERDAKAEAVPV